MRMLGTLLKNCFPPGGSRGRKHKERKERRVETEMTAPPFARGVGGAYIMVDIGIMPVSIAKARESMAGAPLSSAHVSHWLAQPRSSFPTPLLYPYGQGAGVCR